MLKKHHNNINMLTFVLFHYYLPYRANHVLVFDIGCALLLNSLYVVGYCCSVLVFIVQEDAQSAGVSEL